MYISLTGYYYYRVISNKAIPPISVATKTGCNWLQPVFLTWAWLKDWDWDHLGLHATATETQSWAVQSQSGLSLFPVLQLDFKTLILRMNVASYSGLDLSWQLDLTISPPWAKWIMTLCTGDLGTPQGKSSDVCTNIRSTFWISTFQLRIVFALDVLLAKCPIKLSQKMKDVLPSLSS